MRYKFGVFVYDFEHWKTQQGLVNLIAAGFKPSLVLAAPWEELNIQRSKVRIAPRDLYLQHPRQLAGSLGLLYRVVKHNSTACVELIKEGGLDFGIVLGARILKDYVIEAFNYGVLNMHPGILPINRGEDNIKWAVMTDLPCGVTVHFIDKEIDRGHQISQASIKVYLDDTLMDLHVRTQHLEQRLMIEVLREFENMGIDFKRYKPLGQGNYFKTMPAAVEKSLGRRLAAYKEFRSAEGANV
jgi:methionyl-tRNA formyltransferase